MDAEPPVASFLKSKLIGGGPVNVALCVLISIMPENARSTPMTPCADVYCWIEQDSSVMFKAVTKFGDPVELTADDARDIAGARLSLAERLEAGNQNPA